MEKSSETSQEESETSSEKKKRPLALKPMRGTIKLIEKAMANKVIQALSMKIKLTNKLIAHSKDDFYFDLMTASKTKPPIDHTFSEVKKLKKLLALLNKFPEPSMR